MVNNGSLAAFSLGCHGAACGMLLVIAGLLWRDRRSVPVGRLGAALALAAAAHAVTSVPLFQPAGALWKAPILALARGAPAIFWLWARTAFAEDRPTRPWHVLPWGVLAGGGVLVSHGKVPGAGLLAGFVLPALALGLTVLAALQTVTTWRADLVAGRRRLRVAVLVGTVAYIIADIVWHLAPAAAPIGSDPGDAIEAAGLCGLALLASAYLFRIPGEAPDPATAVAIPPAPAPDDRGVPAADPALLRRLDHLMTAERAYRDDGLTIGILAATLQVPEYRLRQAINQGLGQRNFNVFLNRYRIAEARAALADPGQKDVPVLTIALDAGFGSLGPFNRAFKAETGMTPTAYRRSALAAAAKPDDSSPSD